MESTAPDESLLDHWMKIAAQYGVAGHEAEATHAVAGLLAGAMAVCMDVLGRPNDKILLAVFTEVCLRAGMQRGDHCQVLH